MTKKPTYEELKQRVKELEAKISIQKQPYEEVRESENKFRLLLENTNDVIWIRDMDLKLVYVSPSVEKVRGFTPEEAMSQRLEEVLTAESATFAVEKFLQMYEREKQGERFTERYFIDLEHRCKDGSTIWMECSLSYLRDSEGNPTGILGVSRDITDRKQAEDALRESEAKMRSIFRAAPIGIGVVSNRVLLNVNDQFCEITGYSRDELIGQNARMVYPTNGDYEHVGREKYRQIGERGVGAVETHFRCKDGKIIDVLLSSTPLDPNDLSAGVAFTALDITDRKQAEEEFTQIFRMSLDMICIADINTATFIKVNPAFTEILGYSEEELLGRPFLDFIHPEDIDATRTVIEQKLQMGAKVINFENRYRCKDGSYRWLSWVSHPNTENGVTFAVARDITEWKKYEEALKKSKALLDATGRMAKVGGWELDANTLEVSWTEETYRIHEVPLDYTPSIQEAINFFHPEDRDRLKQAIQRSLDHGESYDMEIRFITAQGKHLWTRTICQPEVVDGKTVKLKGTFLDITERKLTEAALRESEKKFRSVIELSPIGVGMVDAEGNLFDCNAALADILGYSVDELRRMSFEQFTHPKDLEKEWPLINRIWAGETDHYRIEKRYITKSGDVIWVKVVGSILRTEKESERFGFAFVEDITERVHLQKALEEQQQELKQTLDATTDGIWAWNFKTNSLFFSPKYYTMLGYEPDEFPADYENWRNLIHPDDREKALSVATEYLKTKPDSYENDFRLKTKSGEYRWIRAHARVVERDENGDAVYMIGNHEDITESKQAQEALKQSERRLRNVLETVDLIAISLDGQGNLTFCNNFFLKLTGWRSDEVLGKNWFKHFLPPEIGDEIKQTVFLKAFQAGEFPAHYQNDIITRHGERRLVNWNNTIFRDSQGNVTGVTSIGEDITDRKKAEDALRASHERFLTVMDSVDATIYVADMQTHEVLFMNKSMIESFGKDMTGELCWEVFRGESGPCPHCTNSRLIDENGKPTDVYVWQDKNPITGKWYINYDRAIEWTDGRLARLQIATDITDFKKIEEELRQAQKMESLGILAGGIAHDFNNILSPIMLHAEMAMMELPQDSPVQQNLGHIYRAGERARDLVKQILTFARKREEDRIPLKTSIIVKEAIKFLRSTIPSTIDIRYGFMAKQETVLADPTQMNQIVMNLCTNAAHAMREKGGVLEIYLSNEYIGPEAIKQFADLSAGHYLRLSVRDTGPGISHDIIDKIFEPYFTTKGPGEGTGMGLAMVHGIVKSYGGDIAVESVQGEGTAFHVMLPVVEAEISTSLERKTDIPRGKERILFVDDEKAAVDIIQTMLEKLGYTVTAKTSSIEALEAFRNRPEDFDLVITDMTMPNMTGKDLAKEMISIRPDIPIILCTGFSEQIDARMAKEIGIHAFVMKPIVMHEIANTIREVLEKK